MGVGASGSSRRLSQVSYPGSVTNPFGVWLFYKRLAAEAARHWKPGSLSDFSVYAASA